jgi:alpha-beta hydrolase superfamily lysophospholipase
VASKDQDPNSRGPVSRFRDGQRAESQSAAAAPLTTAFWFGAPERPLFGWYHQPTAPARAAVVLCNPVGHESLVLHRTYRRLAQHLAAKGFATLRFDYDGTGDSAGGDDDGNRVEHWLSSIQTAIDEVSRQSGASEVVLIGTRVGALLAATQAGRAPVSGVVLIAPPRNGKAWLREARAMQAIKDSQLPQSEGVEPDKGIAGFLLDDTTRAELSGLYLSKLAKAPARSALVVARDDLPGGELELVAHLRDLGVNVEHSVAPGYAASNPEDPFKAVVPVQMFAAISDWLERAYPADREAEPSSTSPSPPVSFATTAVTDSQTYEQVVDISGKFGILTGPASPNEHTKTAVVLLNIGANHHIGSNRMYVNMARAWAAEGFQVLRMDFSGMGDSRVHDLGKENDVYAGRFMAEARSAVDFLKERGIAKVVLMGLCSGAYVAYHTAIADPRVAGVVLINPLTFHWTEGDSLEVRMRKSFGSTEQYKRRLFQVETWKRIVRGEVGVAKITAELTRRIGRRTRSEVRSLLARISGGIAEATDIERGFRRLCARGTSSLLVLGSEDGSRDVIEEHLGKDATAMKVVKGFRMEVWAGTDHTFTPLRAQRRLIRFIMGHLVAEHGNG